MSTIGIDKMVQTFQLSDGTIVEVVIMDTGGQERFNSITSNYYKLADCCLLVYDITDLKSFEKINNYYISELEKKGGNIRKIILLGNKSDLKDERKISSEEGSNLANRYGFVFMESSCKDNYNVSNAFETLIDMTNTELKNNNCQREIVINNFNNSNKKNKKTKFC